MKKTFLILLIICTALLTHSCKEKIGESKNSNSFEISATAPGYNEADGTLNIMGYFVSPQYSGSINSNGKITLELPSDFNTIAQQAFNAYNKEAESGYELSGIGIEDILPSIEDLTISGDQPKLALAGKYYGFEVYSDSIKVGRVFPASSKEFMMHTINADKNEVTTGSYYMIIYSSGNLNIEGMNKSPLAVDSNGDYSLFSNTHYNINLIEGWNIIKYEIKSLVNDEEGNLHAGESVFSSATSDDLDFNWVYISL